MKFSIFNILKVFDFLWTRIPKNPTVTGLNITNLREKILNILYEWESSEEYCYDKIVHNLIIQNNSKNNIVIDRIELTNVQVDKTYSYSDLKFHCGLDAEKQNFKIIAFNNGNYTILEDNYSIYIDRILPGQEKINLFNEIKKLSDLNGGDIECLLNEELENRILPLFDDSNNQILEFDIFNSYNKKLRDGTSI
ncbi:hypothetical protein BVE84_06820 [Streptococcus azizii]|uniref:Uncharacterized protein n=1 Tax=Streptococcus azizii TaxID=1579424 RepID=A0AB36JLG1_9STRE|nr:MULTISPECIES: hypothetical protein [Streptococcus]MBF0775404.1 hypothetical protein [Streptococcus sp. 19428wD3_AN2]ONK26767.1 hypothetical protein BVE86_06640 [Streptococcus azizii]ONK27334.1 hypothetical protein BVE85_06625 [Streptococcus azizii]ONK28278.1 hypothetical protein BVE84_06820 [Streptococcus azizii]TFU84572.1 hypothetical protein E4T83_01245 [Streptococcus sp. AN2]